MTSPLASGRHAMRRHALCCELSNSPPPTKSLALPGCGGRPPQSLLFAALRLSSPLRHGFDIVAASGRLGRLFGAGGRLAVALALPCCATQTNNRHLLVPASANIGLRILGPLRSFPRALPPASAGQAFP